MIHHPHPSLARGVALLGLIAVAVASAAPAAAGTREGSDELGGHGHDGRNAHVLLISVDGLHQSDVDWYVSTHPSSTMAVLVAHGVDYTKASTPFPSDSFPGLVAPVTGGNPSSTGIYYDVSYNRALLPPGTTHCAGVAAGTAVAYDESLDRDPSRLDAGQGLGGLPGSILKMTGHPVDLINRALLPVDPTTCQPVLPHSYLKSNTIFEVAHQAGLRTAWVDKHPAYDIVNGPSGLGVDDLFTPEINSDAPAGGDWTSINASTQQYDRYKVQAVLNELSGLDHSGQRDVGVPAILGLNFQSVSTAEKLPTSGGQAGGYLPGGTVPGPVLTNALDFVDAQLAQMLNRIHNQGLDRSTTIILTAKHGQSPTDPNALTRIADGAILGALDAAWAAGHPGVAPLVTFSIDDDGMLLWLSDRSAPATAFAKQWLLSHPATGNTITGAARRLSGSGLATVYAGREAARFLGAAVTEERHPDLVGVVQHGVVYTGGKKKIAEHGGNDPQDRNVPIIVSSARGMSGLSGQRVTTLVETTQIAPTILSLLGLDPESLRSVRIEHTRTLPGIVTGNH